MYLKAQTGMDLTIRPPKKGKKKKTFSEMYPGLTDIDKKRNTPRARLERKVLNKLVHTHTPFVMHAMTVKLKIPTPILSDF